MAANWMKTRHTKHTAYTTVYIIVVIAVLSVINFLVNRHTVSYDSTSNKQYSLSDQTIKVVRNLKNDVTVYYFDDTTRFPQGRDLLDRYSSLSPKLHVEYVDPVKKPQQAKSAGYRRDVTVLVDNGARKEEAKSLSEEEITGAMIRALKSGERNACFLSFAGEAGVEDTGARGVSYLKQLLERDNYKIRTVDLKPAGSSGQPAAIGQTAGGTVEVPKDCTVLVIAGPQSDYPPAVVAAFKAYMDGGGRTLLMLDNTLPIGRGDPTAENAELVKLLADWGVTFNKDLVLDLSGIGQLFGAGPEVPVITSYESHSITAPLERGMPSAFPMTRSIETKSAGNASAVKLFGTNEDSVAVTSLGAGGRIDPNQGKKGPHTLGAAVTFTGGSQARMVVVGTSLWARNNLIGSRQLRNRDLFGNMVNWLMADEDLISIRPKAPEDRPLNIANRMTLVFWLSVVIFPLAVVGFGMVTWWKRR
jgi:ABC-type uncharacterized transport system involved in gliding motility auxiliary subunit